METYREDGLAGLGQIFLVVSHHGYFLLFCVLFSARLDGTSSPCKPGVKTSEREDKREWERVSERERVSE